MDENSEEGVVLGSVYSDEDLPPDLSNKKNYAVLDNNSFLIIDKEKNSLSVNFENINLNGNINHNGIFKVHRVFLQTVIFRITALLYRQ